MRRFILMLLSALLCNFTGISAFSRESHQGIFLPLGSKALGKKRFQSAKNYEDTLKELKSRMRSHILKIEEIKLPHVRASTLHLTDSKKPVDAINIYENHVTGITEIFFVGASP